MLAKTVTNVKLKATEYGKMFLAMTVLLQTIELSEICSTELTVIQAKSGTELLTLVNETDKQKKYCMNIVWKISAERRADLHSGLISRAGRQESARDGDNAQRFVQAGLINRALRPGWRESWHVLSLLEKQCDRAMDIWHVLSLLEKQCCRVMDLWRVLSLLEKQRCGVIDIGCFLFFFKTHGCRFGIKNEEVSGYEEKKNSYRNCRTSKISRKDLQHKSKGINCKMIRRQGERGEGISWRQRVRENLITTPNPFPSKPRSSTAYLNPFLSKPQPSTAYLNPSPLQPFTHSYHKRMGEEGRNSTDKTPFTHNTNSTRVNLVSFEQPYNQQLANPCFSLLNCYLCAVFVFIYVVYIWCWLKLKLSMQWPKRTPQGAPFRREYQRNDRKPVICYRCWIPGHMRKDCRVSEYRLQRSLDRRDLQETLASRDKAEACMDPALPPGLMVGAMTWFRDSQTVAKAPYCKARIWTGPWRVARRTAKFHWAIAPVHFRGRRVQVIAYVDDLIIFTSPDEDRFTGLGRSQLNTETEHQTEDKTIGFYSRRPAPGAFNDSKPPAGPFSTTDQPTEENNLEEGGLSAPKTQISIVAHPQKWGLESVVFSKPDRNAFSHEKICFDVPKSVGQTSVSHPLPTNPKTMGGQNLSRGLSSEVAGSRGSKLDKSEEWKDQVKFVGFGDSTPKANAGGAPLPSPSVGHSNRNAGETSGKDHSPSSAGGIPSFPRSIDDMVELLSQVSPEVTDKEQGDSAQGDQAQVDQEQGGRAQRNWHRYRKAVKDQEFSRNAVVCYLLATYLLGGAQAYMLSYYNCLDPLQVEKIDETATCTASGPREERPTGKTYALVTDITDGGFRGWTCDALASEWKVLCLPGGDMRLDALPTVRKPQPVTLEECRQMGAQRIYRPPGQNHTLSLQLGEWAYFGVTREGKPAEEGFTFKCPQHHIKLKPHRGTITQLQVRIKPEEFRVRKGRVEAEGDRLPLPCRIQEEGCRTEDRTYTWTGTDQKCYLRRMGTISPNLTQETWLVDHNHRLLLNQTGKYMVPGCNMLVELTQIPNLYMADLTIPERRRQANLLPHMSPEEASTHRETTLRMEYSLYLLHRQMEAATLPTRMKLCHQKKEVFGNTPVQSLLTGGFELTHGELHYQYQCRVAQAEIAEDTRCWKDVPLKGGGFVDPGTRLFTLHSQQVACNGFYPLTIATDEGWVAIRPHLVWQPAPSHLPTSLQSTNGFHSQTEARDWHSIVQDANQQLATLNALTYGDCVGSSACDPAGSQGIPTYRLDQLKTTLEGAGSPVVNARGWLRDVGAGIALVCILLGLMKTASLCAAAFQKRGRKFTWDIRRKQETASPEKITNPFSG